MSVIQISCVEVWREISNYIDGDVSAELRQRIEAHFKICKHCFAIYAGTENVVKLVGDGVAFELPDTFSERLKTKLKQQKLAR